MKVGSLTTYTACTSPQFRPNIRSTCREVTNIPISEDFSFQKSANHVGLRSTLLHVLTSIAARSTLLSRRGDVVAVQLSSKHASTAHWTCKLIVDFNLFSFKCFLSIYQICFYFFLSFNLSLFNPFILSINQIYFNPFNP